MKISKYHEIRWTWFNLDILPYMVEEFSAILQFHSIFQSHRHPKKKEKVSDKDTKIKG